MRITFPQTKSQRCAQETIKKRKLVQKARNDQSAGGKSQHWFVSVSCVIDILPIGHWVTIYTLLLLFLTLAHRQKSSPWSQNQAQTAYQEEIK